MTTTIKVPIATLREYAAKMQGYADESSDIFDVIANSLTAIESGGGWQGISRSAAVTATSNNQKKYKEIKNELQALATFIKKFADDMDTKDDEIKKQITAVSGS